MDVKIRLARGGDGIAVGFMMNKGILGGKWKYNGRTEKWNSKKIKDADELYSKRKNAFCFVAVYDRRIVGIVSFFFKKKGRIRHRVEFGWFVDDDFSGKGVGKNLLEKALLLAKKKGFKRTEAEVAVKNITSIKLAKSCGFKVEGVKNRGMILDNGRFCDTYLMGRLI